MNYTSPTVVEYTARSFNPTTPPRSMPGHDGDLPGTPHTGDSTLVGDSPGLGFGEDKMANVLPGHWGESGDEGNEQSHQDKADDGDIDLAYLSFTPDPPGIDSSDDDVMGDSGEIAIVVSDVPEGLS